MRPSQLLPLLAAAVLTVGAWHAFGWPGLALAAGGVVMWLLLHLTRLMTVLKRAAERPMGHVASAVMLNAKLQRGQTLMHVVAMTRSLGQLQSPKDSQPEVYRWQDAGGSSVQCTFVSGRLAQWQLQRPGSPAMADGTTPTLAQPLPRVMHFVTGGFTGATQVPIDLCLSAQSQGQQAVLLVLRRKPGTTAARLSALRAQGLQVHVVAKWPHLLTIWQLRQLCRQWQPDVLVAHGYSEHLWGRLAGLWAGVPHLVHVEHSATERYTWLRLRLARWLAQRTDALVGVSEGVRDRLVALGFAANRCKAIRNGIVLDRFVAQGLGPWAERTPSVAMAARHCSAKDHATLIAALAPVVQALPNTTLHLYGGGTPRHWRRTRSHIQRWGLQDQVHMHGHVQDMPAALGSHQVFVLSTHGEGIGLALMEAMACGCACVGTDVVGVQELIEHGVTGLLVPENDPAALAEAMLWLLNHPEEAQALGERARQKAAQAFGHHQMQTQYHRLIQACLAGQGPR